MATIVSLLGVQLIPCHARSVQKSKKLRFPWKTYSAVVGVLFGAKVMREIVTSVIAIEKSWYGFFSFCVSTDAWVASLVYSLGVVMMVSLPLALLWSYSAMAWCPKKAFKLDAPDGKCGVGKFLLFAQTWAVVPAITVSVVTGIIFRYLVNELRVSPAYMTEAVVVMALFIFIAIRFVRGAFAIRLIYSEALSGKGETWAEVQASKPPSDPTVSFIGENWWRLPAVVLGFLTVLSGLLAWFGLYEMILGG